MRGVACGVAAAFVLVVAATAVSAGARTRAAAVGVVPSSTTVHATGRLPVPPAHAIALHVARGEQEDAVVVVSGARRVQVAAPASVGPLPLKLFFAHYVPVGRTLVPDALVPWNGAARTAEQPNQPLWVQVTVPAATPPGTYSGTLTVTADGLPTQVPLSVQVFPVTLPPPGQVAGNLLTSFNVSAETYSGMVGKLDGYSQSAQFEQVPPELYSFLASYRISPDSWGYGDPTTAAGYTTNPRWWLDSATNMARENAGWSFAARAIPISNNRSSAADYVAGLSPYEPATWCSYLGAVHAFWQEHGWLDSFPYVYGLDEPGLSGFHLVARQSAVVHRCFPGGRTIVTGNPSLRNRFLWNGGSDDVDTWVVLANRYYGEYTNPRQSRAGHSRAREKLALIDRVRARGKTIWTYTYAGTGTPGFTATEPLADARMLFLWAALENIGGVLYGEGMTSYQGNPYDGLDRAGAYVLVYPGAGAPRPSARLEQIRDGIEDWDLLRIVRQRHGAAAVRTILRQLFSVGPHGAVLGCTIGCPLETATPFSWPRWSHDSTTPAKIEQAKLAALRAASS